MRYCGREASLSASKALSVSITAVYRYSHTDTPGTMTDERVGLGQPNDQIFAVSSFFTALPVPPSSREYLYILPPPNPDACMYLQLYPPISQITRNHSHNPHIDPVHRYPTHRQSESERGRKKEAIASSRGGRLLRTRALSDPDTVVPVPLLTDKSRTAQHLLQGRYRRPIVGGTYIHRSVCTGARTETSVGRGVREHPRQVAK